MNERVKINKKNKIYYNYFKGDEKNSEEEEFNYPDDWPQNDGKLSNIHQHYSFALALASGIKEGKKDSSNSTLELFNPPKSFEKFLLPMINAVAIFESDDGLDVLNNDPQEIYVSAQQYANGGIQSLHELYLEDMDGIINDWHIEIDQIVKNKNIFDKIDDL